MTILLTGGAGFIGSNLADRLLAAGHSVIVLDNFDDFYSRDIKLSNIAHNTANPAYKLVEGDICDKALLQTIFAGNKIDTVIHIAARAGVRPSIANPALYFDVNVNGTLCLLEIMRQNGVKNMLFASSSSVYGNNPSVPFRETDSVDNPISPYAASKKAAELLCYTYYHLHHFNIYCLRLFTVYGPRQRPEMAISYFTDNIYHGKPVNLFGNGQSQRDYTYIDDITSGFMNALNRLNGYQIINIGESRTISLKALVETIETALGKKAIINWLPAQAGDVEVTYADISKAKQVIGYNPVHSIEQGIAKYVAYYLRHSVANKAQF